MKAKDILDLKRRHPEAVMLVHPESNEDICDMADEVLSTSQMLRFCRESSADTFIIGTEMGLLHRLRRDMPGKTFLQPSKGLICPNMKMTRLEDVFESLMDLQYPIEIPEPVRERALRAIDGMLATVPAR
jgi:quinolinate synthase